MQLYHKTYGKGSPLIILHGLFGSSDNWHTLANKFGEHFQVFTIDQRNHGKSPHSEDFSLQLMANDIKDFMKRAGLEQAAIIGHSMGGKVAMQLAMTYPELIDKLIVVDIAPKQYESGHDNILRALNKFPINSIASRKEADEKLAMSISDFGVRQFLLKNINRNEDNSYSWKMNLSAITRHYNEITKAIVLTKPFTNPTLFIKGEKSIYIQESNKPLIDTLFSNAAIKSIENSGHWVHAEAPEEFYEMVLEFLN